MDEETKQQLMTDYSLSKEQVISLRETLALFDKHGEGALPLSDLGSALRAMGQNPTEQQIQALTEECEVTDGHITFEEFVRISASLGLKEELERVEEIEEALRTFDKDGNGAIGVEELRAALTTLGEPLDEEDMKELISVAEISEGQLNYYDFAQKMIEK